MNAVEKMVVKAILPVIIKDIFGLAENEIATLKAKNPEIAVLFESINVFLEENKLTQYLNEKDIETYLIKLIDKA